MSSSRTHSGNKKPLQTRTCLGCKLVYKSRKGNPVCPRCHRKHHTGKLFTGLLADNKKNFKKYLNKKMERVVNEQGNKIC